AVVGVEMRAAEIVAGEPLVDHDVEPGLRRIADQYGAAVATGAFPLDLVGQLEDQGLGIELDRAGRAGGENRDADCHGRRTLADHAHGASPVADRPAWGPGARPSVAGPCAVVQPPPRIPALPSAGRRTSNPPRPSTGSPRHLRHGDLQSPAPSR